MALYNFSGGGGENLFGSAGVADTFQVTNLSYFTGVDTINALPSGEGSPNYDTLLFSIAGTTFNLNSYTNVNGIESHELIDSSGFIVTWNQAYATNNLGFNSVFYIGSTLGTNAAALNLNGSGTTLPIQFAGAAGPDTLVGGDGADTAIGRDGGDYISLGVGADSLLGENGPDTLLGGSDADTLFGGLNADSINGGAGADKLYFAILDVANSECLDGGAGVDTLALDTLAAGTYSFNDATLANAEVIQGGGYADSVVLSLSQTAIGGGQVTLVDLGGGTDKATITGVNVTINLQSSSTSFANIEGLQLNLNSTITLTAPFDQTFPIAVSGGFEVDYYGSTVSDSIWGDAGTDYLYGQGGGDVMLGRSNNDHIYGNQGADTLFGGSGADHLYGNSGADVLVGGAGADQFHAHSGADTVFGGDGPDTVDDNGPDAAGILVIADAAGESGDDMVYGNAGSDTLVGGLGNDLLAGHGAADVLIGGAGEDTLSGGYGVDVMWGEAGIDKFIFASGYGFDMIADFQPGVDKIQLSNFDAISTFGSFQAIAAINTTYVNAVVVTMTGGEQLSIIGAVGGLSATDFII